MLDEQRLKRLVAENQVFLDLLEESDRTGVLRKASYKERVNFTIDEMLMSDFRRLCNDNKVNMSAKIEDYIYQIVKKGSL